MSDAELLQAIAEDPEGGIRAAVTVHGSLLLGRLRKYASDKRYGDTNVKDIWQLSFLRLLKPEVRSQIRVAGGGILPFLCRWGYWRLADLARHDAIEIERTSAPPTGEIGREPSAAAKAVEAALPRLSPRDQDLIRWRYEEGLGHEEMAIRLGIRPGAAKKALHDARGRLRDLLHQAGVTYD